MANYKVKIPFNFYKQGDVVTEKEYNKYGPAYFDVIPDNKMMDASNIITKDSVIEKPEPEAQADTEKPGKTKKK